VRAVLDTHVLIEWIARSPQLSREQRRMLGRATAAHPLYVSDISLWEIATLYERARIRLRLPLRDWLEAAVAPPIVQRIGISPRIAAEVADLPSSFHRDPADRIIVASTRVLGATLLTRDSRIVEADLVPTIA
jgi:PIN domain nuclease of toxin-antitoxin system